MRNRVFSLAVILGLWLGAAQAQVTPVLYGITFTNQLITINTSTGAATLVGTIPGASMHPFGLATNGGKLYTFDQTIDRIVQLDPATGGILNTIDIGVGDLSGEGALAFRSDGTGFLTRAFAPAAGGLALQAGIGASLGALYSFSLSGTSTLITSSLTPAMDGLDFSPSGVLYGLRQPSSFFGPNHLFTIDPTTGATTLIGGNLSGANLGGLAFRSDGVLFGVVTQSPAGLSILVTFDLTTGIATLIGIIATCQGDPACFIVGVSGIAFLGPDAAGPIASNVAASPNPVAVGTATTLTARLDDATTGGSTIASAEYNIDGGAFLPMNAVLPPFNAVVEDVTATIGAFTSASLHTICIRGKDAAGNVGSAECIQLVIYDPNAFVTGGGGINSPAGADLGILSAAGPAVFAFVVKYLPGQSVPSGNLQFQFHVGNLDFRSTSMNWLVVTGQPRAIFRGVGTINRTTACKFELDAWDGSFQPGSADAFGLKIFSCAGSVNRYNLPAAPLTRGNITSHGR